MQALHSVNNTAPAQERDLQQSKAALNRISLDSQLVNQAEERRRLTKEHQVIRESLNRGDCAPVLRQRWPDHRAMRQTFADKFARLGQNLVGLSKLGCGVVEIGEC